MTDNVVRFSGVPEILSVIFEMALFDSEPSSPLVKALCTRSSMSLYHMAIDIFNKVNIFTGDITVQKPAVKARIRNIRIRIPEDPPFNIRAGEIETRLWWYNHMIPTLFENYKNCISTSHIELDLTPLDLDGWRTIIRNPRFCDEISLEKDSLTSVLCQYPSLRTIFVRLSAVVPNQRSVAERKTLQGIVKAGVDPIFIQGRYKDVHWAKGLEISNGRTLEGGQHSSHRSRIRMKLQQLKDEGQDLLLRTV